MIAYSKAADRIPSLPDDYDSSSPTSGEVAWRLRNGESRYDILRRWLGARAFIPFKADRNSEYNVSLVDGNFLDGWRRDHPGKKMTFHELYDILKSFGAGKVTERKFIDDVPFNGDYMKAIWDRWGQPNPEVANMMGVPYITDGVELDAAQRKDAINMGMRKKNVFRGDLDVFRNK